MGLHRIYDIAIADELCCGFFFVLLHRWEEKKPRKEKSMDEVKNENMDLLNVEQAAAYLNFSKTYLYRLARANRIPHVNFGRHIIFRKKDLYDWLGSLVQGA